MMQGRVDRQCEAVISVAVRGEGKLKSVDAVIDTGFNGFLSLPIAIVMELDKSKLAIHFILGKPCVTIGARSHHSKSH